MTDRLEIFRRSAEAMGYELALTELCEPVIMRGDAIALRVEGGWMSPWNPFDNAEQRWECVEWLLAKRWYVEYAPDDGHFLHDYRRVANTTRISCPANELAARAVAEIWRTKVICPKHNRPLECFGGLSAHESNWSCPECDAEVGGGDDE